MLTNVSQRWTQRRSVFLPPAKLFNPSRYEVVDIPSDNVARAFVMREHYSGTYPSARERFGLYERGGELVGVIVFSHPMSEEVLDILPCSRKDGVELGRLVLLDRVPFNAESWFVAQAFRLLRAMKRKDKSRKYRNVVSFSDPFPRFAIGDPKPVFVGHIGQIYQASNAVYLGRAPRRTERITPDGRLLCARTISKIRGVEVGWENCVDSLVEFGAERPTSGDDLRAWLKRQVPLITRCVRHPGKFRYAFDLDDGTNRRVLPRVLRAPYPKFDLGAAA
jgi:hypothetical protein